MKAGDLVWVGGDWDVHVLAVVDGTSVRTACGLACGVGYQSPAPHAVPVREGETPQVCLRCLRARKEVAP